MALGSFFFVCGECLEHLGHLRGIWSIWGIWDICGLRASLCGLHFGKSFLRIVPVEEVISLRSSAVFGLRFSAYGLQFAACALVPYLPCALSCAPCLSCFAYLACIVYVPCTTSLPHDLFFTPYPSLCFGDA